MDIMLNIFHDNISKCFSESFFPGDLKREEVIPILKKDIKKDLVQSVILKMECRKGRY